MWVGALFTAFGLATPCWAQGEVKASAPKGAESEKALSQDAEEDGSAARGEKGDSGDGISSGVQSPGESAPEKTGDKKAGPVEKGEGGPSPLPPYSKPTSTAAEVDTAEIEAALAADQKDKGERNEADVGASASSGLGGGTNLLNPQISVILDVAGAYFSDDDNLQSGAHDPTETGFNLQQLEFAVGANVDPYFRFDANLVFGLFGVELEEAYGTTLALPLGLQVRFGQFLTRFGRINATHPHSWDFADQPFAVGRNFGAEGSRGLGVEASWLTPLPWYVELVASTTNANGGASNVSFFGNEESGC